MYKNIKRYIRWKEDNMMKYCSICGNKIGGWGEEKYEYSEGKIACYRCVKSIREIEKCQDVNKLHEKIQKLYKDMKVPSQATILIEDLKLEERLAQLNKIIQLKTNMLLSTSHNFEGYIINRYLGIVEGEIVLGTGMFSAITADISDFLGTRSAEYEKKMSQAKNVVMEQMKGKAAELDGNAILGIDFDITTIGNNMIMISCNGTAVEITKIE